mgnify:CR=1 FL=1
MITDGKMIHQKIRDFRRLNQRIKRQVIKIFIRYYNQPVPFIYNRFNRFYQVPAASGQQGGSGIGLAFAKNIVELHNGTIDVSSTPGQGTVFTIRMPMRQKTGNGTGISATSPEHEDEPQAGMHPLAAASQHDHRQSILVIDDNDDIRGYLAGLLKEDFEILEADNGSSGYKVALEAMPDLIISDVMMPQMNGSDLCKELKNNMATSHIPIILLTARASEAYELNGLQTGADDYITKPFNLAELQLRLANLLDQQERQRKHLQQQMMQAGPTIPPATDQFVQDLYNLVELHLDDPQLGVDLVAEQMGMSRSSLNRKLQALLGMGANDLIRNYRLKKAAALLDAGHDISQAAYQTGFNTPSYFSLRFREFFGKTPSEYISSKGLRQN